MNRQSLKFKVQGSKLKNFLNFQSLILLFIIYCLLFTLTGCGGAPAQKPSNAHITASEYSQKAAKAVEKGDNEKALSYYMEALKINRSVENTEGIAVNLINMSAIYQKKGDTAKARELIGIALSMPDISAEARSEAAYEQAKIYLKEKNTAKAKEWIDRSLSLYKGPLEGAKLNLAGRIAFAEGKYDEALIIANKALTLNKENEQRTEEANSLRLMAEINAQKGLYAESKALYMKALEIDKELGNSGKIAMTLSGMGALSSKQEKYQDAITFYMRAYDVSSSAGDVDGALEALDALSDAYRKSGDEKKAEEMLKKKSDIKIEKKK